MSERERWLPTDDEIHLHLIHKGGIRFISDYCRIVRDLLRATVERALAEQDARHRREVIEALIYELDNATRAVCQGCAEGIDYWPADGSHRRQISDDGDCEGGPCNCHELSDRLHGLRAELAALDKEADRE